MNYFYKIFMLFVALLFITKMEGQCIPCPRIAYVDPPADLTLACGETPPPATPLFYTNNADPACLQEGWQTPTVNGDINGPSCRAKTITYSYHTKDFCGSPAIDFIRTITIPETPRAAFVDPPADVTVDCDDAITDPSPLFYTNNQTGNCLIEGEVPGTRLGIPNVCGDVVRFVWEFTDECGRAIFYTQTVINRPAPAPEFIDPPENAIVECGDIPEDPLPLEYSNFGTTILCLISGIVEPEVTENYDSCGGNIIYIWEFTDLCGNRIEHTQELEILPVPEPEFSNIPDDIDLLCYEDIPDPTPINYTNYEKGKCAIEGLIWPVVTQVDNIVYNTYTFINACSGVEFYHVQIITIPGIPDIEIDPITDTICLGEEYDLIDVYIFDLNNVYYDLTYHSAIPPTIDNELFDYIVSPIVNTTYYFVATSDDGCQDIEEFNLIIRPAPNAGEDNEDNLCFGATEINLFDYLVGADNNNGQWVQISGNPLDISDPTSVDFTNQNSGSFLFEYILSSEKCEGDIALIELILKDELKAEILSVECTIDQSNYTVEINADGNTITTNEGVITGPVNNIYTISLIPIAETLTIVVSSTQDDCELSIDIPPPNCACTNTDSPVSLGNKEICFGDMTPTLSVQVGPDQTANWYDAPNGGTLLLSTSLSYTPSVTAPGIYTYYVETESVLNAECKSTLKTPISLQIFALPQADNGVLEQCANDESGLSEFDLNLAESELTNQLGYTFEYYLNAGDAQNQGNPLTSPYQSTSSPQTLFVRVMNANNCFIIVELGLISNAQPTISVNVSPETCLGLNDGKATIISTSDNPPIEYSITNFFYFTENEFDNIAIGNHTAYVRDAKSCTNSMDFVIDPGLELLTDLQFDCNNNDTEFNENDDYFDINFTINNSLNTPGRYKLEIGGIEIGIYDYSAPIQIQLNADDSSPVLVFTDVTFGCSVQSTIGPLIDCSESCEQNINAGRDQVITCNVSNVSLTGSSNEVGIYSWSGPNSFTANTLEVEVDANGWYYLSATYPNGCTAIDSVFVDIDSDIPVVEAGPDRLINCLIPEVILNGSNSSTGTDLIFEWTDEQGNVISNDPFLIVAEAGTFYLQIINLSNNCKSPKDEVVVDKNISTPEAIIYSDPGFILSCVIETIVLSTMDQENVAYTWTVGNQDFYGSIKIMIDSGFVSLYALDTITGCDNITGIDILDFTEFPFVKVEDPDPIDCVTPFVTISANQSQRSRDIITKWYDELGTILSDSEYIIDVFEPGIYYFNLRDTILGCERTDSVIVEDIKELPIVNAGLDIEVNCEDANTFSLQGSSSSSGINPLVEWTTIDGNILGGSNTLNPTIDEGGVYVLSITNYDNSCSNTDSMIVIVTDDGPRAAFVETQDISCYGGNDGSISIGSVTGGTSPYQYIINGQVLTNSDVQDLDPGLYQLEIIDANGCEMDTSFTILDGFPLYSGVQVLSQTESELELEYGTIHTLYVLVNIPEEDIESIQWFPSTNLSCDTCLITDLEALDDQNFEVIITDKKGCITIAYLKIIIKEDLLIYIPNTYSPNGDGNNDWFTLYSDRSIKSISYLKIFNRWGDKVFQRDNFAPNIPELGWDGFHNGQEVNPAVFVYVAEVVYRNGTKELFAGDVTLIR